MPPACCRRIQARQRRAYRTVINVRLSCKQIKCPLSNSLLLSKTQLDSQECSLQDVQPSGTKLITSHKNIARD
jgi:hypothetical protein